MANQTPEQVFRHGGCQASIFINTVKKNGAAIDIPKVCIAKRYCDSQRNWQSTSSLDVNDVPKMILALSRAYQHLTASKSSSANGVEEVEE